MAEKNNLAKNTILLSFGTFLTKGLSFIMVPFFSSWLSTEDYGTFDLFCTYVTLLIPLISLSSSDAIFRLSMDEDSNGRKSCITNGLAIHVFDLLIFAVIYIFVCCLTGWNYAFPFFLLLTGELINKFLQGFLRAIKRLDIYSFCSAIITVIIAVSVTITVRFLDMGLYGIIIGYAFGYIIGDFIIAMYSKLYNFIDLKRVSLKGSLELIKYSVPLIPNSVSWWIINVSDRFLINVFLGATFNGLYAIAYKIPNLCSSIFGVFSISWQEAATEITDDKERSTYFNSVYNSMTSEILSLCIGVLSCNFILFNYIFDNKYYEARLYAPVLVAAIIFTTFSQYYGGIQISLKRPKENGITTVVGAVVNFVVNLLFIKLIGLYAACISTLVSNIVVVVLRRNRLKGVSKFKLEKINYLYALIFVYYFGCCYFELPLYVSILNLTVAAAIFLYVNKNMITKFLNKLKHR